MARINAALRVGAWILLALALALAHAHGAAAKVNSRTLSILVMGDSYSAGNGAGDYYGAKRCWRSHRNYAEDFANLVQAQPYRQKTTVTNAACSGATTSWVFNKQASRPPEIDAVNRDYDLVFLTIGGNDIHFADVVRYCLIAGLRDGAHCRQDLDRALELLKDGSVESSITHVLRSIEARADPSAKVVVLGYPYLEGDRTYQLTDRREDSISITGDPCAERQGRTTLVPVGKCLYKIADAGDEIQQKVVDELNNQTGTRPFLFLKTKKLFEGPPSHELFAKRNNPQRWFIQPFLDAGILNRDVFYHPNPTGWYQEARLLLSQTGIPKHPALTITENGKRLGKLNVLPYGDAAANLEHLIRVFGNPTNRYGKPVHPGCWARWRTLGLLAYFASYGVKSCTKGDIPFVNHIELTGSQWTTSGIHVGEALSTAEQEQPGMFSQPAGTGKWFVGSRDYGIVQTRLYVIATKAKVGEFQVNIRALGE